MCIPTDPSRPDAVSRRVALTFLPLALAVLAGGLIAALAAGDPPVPTIAGVRVVAFTPEPIRNERDPVNRPWSFTSPFQPLGQGTHVEILIPCPAGGFLSPALGDDEKLGKILMGVDSRGKDLTTPRVHQIEGNEWPVEAAIREARVAGDGSAAVVTLFVPQTPTPGAGSIDLRAEVTLKHCPATQEFKAAGVKLRREGAAFQLGPIQLKVGKVSSFEHHGRPAEVATLETREDCRALRAIELQVDGKTLHEIDTGLAPRGNGADRSSSFQCDLKGLPDQVDVVASFYQDFEKPVPITIAVAVTVGLGLAAGQEGEASASKVGPGDPLVTVAGFEILDPSIPRRVRSSSKMHGTTIALTLVPAEGGILKIDPEQSKIGQVTDSAGKDLTAPRVDEDAAGGKILPGFGDVGIAEAGSSAGIEIQVPQAPTPGSNQIRFSASIAMLCSAGSVEFKATPADLDVTGAKFEAGPFHFEVKAPEAAGKGDRRQPCSIEMKTRRDLEEIKQVALKAGDRTYVAERGMSGRFAEENKAVWAIPGLDKLPASAEVVVTLKQGQELPKTVMVPVEGMIGLGLRPQR